MNNFREETVKDILLQAELAMKDFMEAVKFLKDLGLTTIMGPQSKLYVFKKDPTTGKTLEEYGDMTCPLREKDPKSSEPCEENTELKKESESSTPPETKDPLQA